MTSPTSILESLFAVLPIESAMPRLVPQGPRDGTLQEAWATVDRLVHDDLDPALAAGLWLYVDDLDRSHTISQNLSTTEGSLWHAIMHRREGDFSNSKYWLRQAGDTSVLESVYGDPFAFVDRVSQEHRGNPADLIALQRSEWLALFEHCAKGSR